MAFPLALLTQPQTWAALLTLILMEVVLGIDNLIFVSFLSYKLPDTYRAQARFIGLSGALLVRIGLLFTLTRLVGLTQAVIHVFGHGFSWRDLILIAGGLFLVYKATSEIGHSSQVKSADPVAKVRIGFVSAIVQILWLDIIFSFDSILTAVGMTDQIFIMVVAVIIAVILMFLASNAISNFMQKHASIVMLALAFLLMIGMVLIAEGFGQHIDRGYIYAAMVFAGFVEALHMLRRKSNG